jgi:2-polyprenyl-3-methyl-5-hydroxy-6-metoxy-1,4-benzoquinol methylase
VAADLPASLDGVRVLHLACGAGEKSLDLARRGAMVIGVDPSREDILSARHEASVLGIAARFVISEIEDLRHMLPEPESFGVVLAPTLVAEAHADIVGWFLEPDGRLVLTD